MSLLKKLNYDAKVSDIEGKIPSVSGLITTSALTVVEIKIPSVSNLVKKTDYDTKFNEIKKKIIDHKHDKYVTTPEFNKLTAENFAERLVKANLVIKRNFDYKLSGFNERINTNKTQHLIVQNELKKLKIFDSNIFVVKVVLMKMAHKVVSISANTKVL